jgi:RND superfamily putative drug exporter
VILVWLALVIGLAVGFGSNFSDNLTAADGSTPGSESNRATKLLETEFGLGASEQDLVVLESAALTVDDPAFAEAIRAGIAVVQDHPAVAGTVSPLAADGAHQISPDGHSAFIALTVEGSPTERQIVAEELGEALEAVASTDVDVWLTGESPLVLDVDQVAGEDLARAETIGLPVALIVLVLAFGALVAAGLPLLLAVAGIGATFGVLGLVSYFAEFNLLTENITTLIGLGVGIDFAMFIVARFREGLAEGRSVEDATRTAVATTGRSVLFSGLTTVIAMSGLFFVDSSIFHDLAIAVMVTVAVMVAAALTLLPAVLAALGRRVNKGRLLRRDPAISDDATGGWATVARAVMRRPGAVTLVAGSIVLALAAPGIRLELGMSSGTDAVSDLPSGRGLAVLEDHFSEGAVSPIEIVVTASDGELDGGVGDTAIEALVEQLRSDDGIATAEIVAVTDSAAYLSAASVGAPDSDEAEATVGRIRTDLATDPSHEEIDVAIGGQTAAIVDQADEMRAKLPIVIGYVLLVTFALLTLVFRSPLLSLKAIVMNLLSVGAAYGLVVLVFQYGLGESMFGFSSPGYIQSYLPLFAFVVLFGISMDYELFLLGRMREEWESTGDDGLAVSRGMQHTARPITSAAAIQASVFGAFAFTSVIDVQEVGFALAAAILIDATIVRALLVPASMKLMGRWNWWTPAWLDRALPRVRLAD